MYSPTHFRDRLRGRRDAPQAHPAKAVAAHGHTAQKGSEKGAGVWDISCHGSRPDAEPLSGERLRPRCSGGNGRTMRALTKACLPRDSSSWPTCQRTIGARTHASESLPWLRSWPPVAKMQRAWSGSSRKMRALLLRESTWRQSRGSASLPTGEPSQVKEGEPHPRQDGRPRGKPRPGHLSRPHGRQARPSPAITPLSSAPCLEGPAPAWVTGGGGRRRCLEFLELGRIAAVACLGIPVPARIASGTCLEIPVRVCIASGTCLEIPVRVWLSEGPTHPSTEEVKHSASKSVQAPTGLSTRCPPRVQAPTALSAEVRGAYARRQDQAPETCRSEELPRGA